jgi:hypothetical protein
MLLGDARRVCRQSGAFRRRIQQVLGICRDVMGKGEGQWILQASNGAKRLVDEGLATIEVTGDRVGEASIDAGDDQGRFTVLAQAGIGRQIGAGLDALLEGVDGFLKPAEAETGGTQRAIGQPLASASG